MSRTETQKAIQEFFQQFDTILKKLQPDSSRDDALQVIQEAQQYFNSNMSVLMDYDKNQVQRQIDEKRKLFVDDKREKKKFSFRNKRVIPKKNSTEEMQHPIQDSNLIQNGDEMNTINGLKRVIPSAIRNELQGELNVKESDISTDLEDELESLARSVAVTIRGIHNNPHYEHPSGARGEDFLIEGCDNSTIIVSEVAGTAYLRNLYQCTVVMSTVRSSIMLHNCKNCTFYLASQQIRIHHCEQSIFYLFVTSDPIIEHSTNLSFGEYKSTDPVILKHLEEEGMLPKANKFANVKDFGWLQSGQSPNWKLI